MPLKKCPICREPGIERPNYFHYKVIKIIPKIEATIREISRELAMYKKFISEGEEVVTPKREKDTGDNGEDYEPCPRKFRHVDYRSLFEQNERQLNQIYELREEKNYYKTVAFMHIEDVEEAIRILKEQIT